MKAKFFLWLIFAPIFCRAQQDPLYSQYMLNPLLINPAYAGLNNKLNAVAGYRTQWAGFDGQPQTINFNAHTSLVDNKLGVGAIFTNDKIGNISNTEINLSASYKLLLNESTFSFGMQAGFQSFRTDYSDLNVLHGGDFAFSGGERGTRINIGAGAILKNERFFVGFSVPRLMPSTFETGGVEFELYNQHFYLAGSYVYFLNEHIRLKPFVMFRGVKGAPLSTDFAFNFNINAKHTLGALTRNLQTYGLLLQTTVHESLRFGYVLEIPTNKSVGQKFVSHEVMLGFAIPVFGYHDTSMFSSF